MPELALLASASRSAVPDLLFEDAQHARIHEIQAHLADAATLPPDAPLHRLTVFLTYQCNLDCPYCKTIARTPAELALRPEKLITMRLADVEMLHPPDRADGGRRFVLSVFRLPARGGRAAGEHPREPGGATDSDRGFRRAWRLPHRSHLREILSAMHADV